MDPSRRGLVTGSAVFAAAPLLSVRNVLDFGATPDGGGLSTGAIQKSIDAAEHTGGGVVYVPPGRYVTGTIRLKANVTLHLEAAAA